MKAAAAQVVVAGHICLDVIPTFLPDFSGLASLMTPGSLTKVGPAVLSTGGAVSNTGLALHRLGVDVKFMGKIGADLFGEAILSVLRRHDPALTAGMIISPDEASSYTIVLNPPGVDRIFIHCPGPNDTFGAADVNPAALAGVRLYHFGYPPLMRRMYLDGGAELVAMMAAVRASGVTTSLDMSQPDPDSDAGRVDWHALIRRVLPHVDIFAPSLDEMVYMLDRPRFGMVRSGVIGALATGAYLADLTDQMLEMGAALVMLKLGDQGLYVRTTPNAARLAGMGPGAPADAANWLGRELLTPCYRVNVAGTTGAGDCTIAGFLTALLAGLPIEECVTAAVAVGACSVETSDATSGVPHWSAVQARLAAGWGKHPQRLQLDGWRERGGLWFGPHDQN